MKVLVLIFVTVLFFGCGVETNSSGNITDSDSSITDDGTGTDDGTDTGTDTEDTDDSNTTDSTDGTGDTTVVIDDATDAGFNKTDAELDSNACTINTIYQAILDSSFDPNAAADAANGLTLMSQYPYSVDLEATNVALFYPDLIISKQDSNLHIYEDSYQFSFDKAWETNANARVYIRTPKDIYGAYSCYRYELDSVSGGSITKTKVYR